MRLDDKLMREAKALALKEGVTFTALIEGSLRERIARSQAKTGQGLAKLPVSQQPGGLREGLDVELFRDNEALADELDALNGHSGR